jgi:mannosylglycerate hydrolase
MALSLTRQIAGERIRAEARALRPFATTPNVLLMNGYEQVPWADDVLPILAEVNQAAGCRFRCAQSLPGDYLAAVRAAEPELPVAQGYFYSGRYMPILKGVFSSRSHLKLLNNECQRELERWAEPFATLAWTIGVDYPRRRLGRAWKTLLLNHTHDDVCGCAVDPIVRDMEARFEQVMQLAGDVAEASLRALANSVDTRNAAGPLALVVFNPSPRERREVIGFRLELPPGSPGLEAFHIEDGHGGTVPQQIAARAGDKVDLYLYAAELPVLGYRTYDLVAGDSAAGEHPVVSASAETRSLDNEHLRVLVNADGTLEVTEKQTGHVYRNLGFFEDGGDAGDTYDYSPPRGETLISSLGKPATITLLAAGPLLARFKVEIELELPVGLTEDRQARSAETRAYPIVSLVELAAGSRRVEIKTVVHNVVKDHRLRVLFPTGLAAVSADGCYAEEPFDVARWPIRGEEPSAEAPELGELGELMPAGRYTAPVHTNPFQNFVDYTDGKRGLAVISRRVTEHEVLPDRDGAVALTLLRSVGWLARYDLLTRTGDVGPHIFTPEAQCLGEHVFHYALYPHRGDWSEDKTHIQAMSHNLRPRVVATSRQAGKLPRELAFVSLESREPPGALRITALKQAEAGDGVVIRFFNTLDVPVEGELSTWWPKISRVVRTNLNEDEQDELAMESGVVRLKVKAKEIVTVKLELLPQVLIDLERPNATRVLAPPSRGGNGPRPAVPPVLTDAEVQAEKERVGALEQELVAAKAAVFNLEDEIERTATQADLGKQLGLQRAKTEVATLTRKVNEARISALLTRKLYVSHQIEDELGAIAQEMSWSRTKKRAGEYLVHHYERLLRRREAQEQERRKP